MTDRVLIAGGGVAALEALIALRELAGDRLHLTPLAPEHDSLLVAVGAPQRTVYDRAITFGADGAPDALAGLLSDLENGTRSAWRSSCPTA
jgi:hypothetical protein